MRIVYKYPFPQKEIVDGDIQLVLELPVGSQILSVQYQRAELVLWAVIDLEVHEMQTRKFRVFGTGMKMPNKSVVLSFIATLQDDYLVWHIFEDISTVQSSNAYNEDRALKGEVERLSNLCNYWSGKYDEVVTKLATMRNVLAGVHATVEEIARLNGHQRTPGDILDSIENILEGEPIV